MVILNTDTYNEICSFILKFSGLNIYCEEEITKAFSSIDPQVVIAILCRERQKHTRKLHHNIQQSAAQFLDEYKRAAQKNPNNPSILLNMAIREGFPPVSLCRILLQAQYTDRHKSVVSNMLKYPYTISDASFALNVLHCTYNDNSDGQLTDLIRRTIGEDYEVRLKKMASDAGLVFHDEVYQRKHGYDKTPDLKLLVPCMYKGRIINWIESKALFGDMESHKHYIKEQLTSYGNRFGSGLVIYWFGYLDTVGRCIDNGDYIFVADDFPKQEDLTLINLPFS